MLALIGLGAAVFTLTNIDDLLLMVGFLSDPTVETGPVVAGQYTGIAALYIASLAASQVVTVVPPAILGLLGFVPLAIGLGKLAVSSVRRTAREETPCPHRGFASVFAVTLANGGDNVASYTPIFATHSGSDIAIIGVVFAVMTGLWCAAASWIVGHRRAGAPIRRWAVAVLPYVLIGLGAWIIGRSGAAGFLASRL